MFAYMINCHGQPLMPCQPRKARVLLKAGKAKVIKMVPFTLQLLYGSSGYKQEISLGSTLAHSISVSQPLQRESSCLRLKYSHEPIYRNF